LIGETFVAVWEGTDGSGKTTLLRRVARILRGKGFRVVTHKTPGALPSGRFAALYGNRPSTPPLARLLLFLANTVDETRPMLLKLKRLSPHYLLIDRYYLCSVAYGLALLEHRMDLDAAARVGEIVSLVEDLGRGGLLYPDVYIFVDVSEEERLRRVRGKRGGEKRLEADTGFQNVVRRVYAEFLGRASSPVLTLKNESGMLERLSAETAERLIAMRGEAMAGGGATGLNHG
jgi:dTMP kinase